MKHAGLAALGLLVGACIPQNVGHITESYPQHAPRSGTPVVVLPFANTTMDMDGPPVLRERFVQELRQRGWAVMDPEVVDEKLRMEGITQGGQLGGIDTETLYEILGVQHMFYGNVLAYSNRNLGMYISRHVKLDLALVHAPTGQDLWLATGEGMGKELHLPSDDEKLGEAFARGVVSGLLQSSLKAEIEQAMRGALASLPSIR